MNTNQVRARVNGYGLYHLTLAFLLGAMIASLVIVSMALTVPANAAGRGGDGVNVPTHQQNHRPCVGKREFNSIRYAETKRYLEARWEVTGRGIPAEVAPIGPVTVYKRCGVPLNVGWYGVVYTPDDGKLYGDVLVAYWEGSAQRITMAEQADTHVRRLHVTYAERVGPGHRNLYFEYNDGATGYATPCRYEDSLNCWWDGDRRGNGHGHGVLNFGEGQHLTVRNSLLNRGLAA